MRYYTSISQKPKLFAEYGDQLDSEDAIDLKIWRNSTALFRGAEYQRFTKLTSKEALTFCTLNSEAV